METTKHLTATLVKLDAMQRRVAKDGWGRNAASAERTIDDRYAVLLAAVQENDAWCDLLDSTPRLAAMWNRVERMWAGCPA